jgi:hypothetical protein
MNDFDRSDFMDKVVFWVCVVGWVVVTYLVATGSI